MKDEVEVKRKYGGTGLGLAICKSIVEGLEEKHDLNLRKTKGLDFILQFQKTRSLI